MLRALLIVLIVAVCAAGCSGATGPVDENIGIDAGQQTPEVSPPADPAWLGSRASFEDAPRATHNGFHARAGLRRHSRDSVEH